MSTAERLEAFLGWVGSVREIYGYILVDDGAYVMAYEIADVEAFCDEWERKRNDCDYLSDFCDVLCPVASPELIAKLEDDGVYITCSKRLGG
jgi:hypothetical protein